MININVDFNKNIGKIKPVHGVGQPPITGVSTKYFNYLSEANIPAFAMFLRDIFVNLSLSA